MIESFVPGRVRLRSRLLTNPDTAGRLRGYLMDIRGVRAVSLNDQTGGLLLEYDTRELPLSLLSKALPLFERLQELEKEAPQQAVSAVESVFKELKSLLEGN